MTLQVLTGPKILAGQSLSDGLDCRAGTIVRITMPAAWSSAPLTFQISSDGGFYNDLFDQYGREMQIRVTPGAAIRVPPEWSPIAAFVKLRSGKRRVPIIQPADREFAITIDVA